MEFITDTTQFIRLGGAGLAVNAHRAIAEAKQYKSIIGRVTKIYYLELLRASEDTLNCWSRLYFQSLELTPVSRRVDDRQTAGRKNNC
jgi:hypothetical protein